MAMTNRNQSQMFTELVKWITANGGEISERLKLNYISNSNRTIITKSRIKPKTTILAIPKSICIHEDNITKRCPTLTPWLKSKRLDSMGLRLAFLLYEMQKHTTERESSFFSPYLASLPEASDLQGHPLYTANKTNLSKWAKLDHHFTNHLEKNLDKINSYHQSLQELNSINNIFDPKTITHQQILWGYTILKSRVWGNLGLIPFLELFQHQTNGTAQVTHYKNSNLIELQINDTYQAKSEVFSYYGNHDDIQLLATYGFIDEQAQNPIINTTVTYELTKDRLGKFIEKEIKKNKFTDKHYLTQKGPPPNLVRFLRLISLSKQDFDLITTHKLKDFLSKPISLNNEYNILHKLLIMINGLKEDQLQTSISACHKLLNKDKADVISIQLAKSIIRRYAILNNCCRIIHQYWVELLQSPYIDKKFLNGFEPFC